VSLSVTLTSRVLFCTCCLSACCNLISGCFYMSVVCALVGIEGASTYQDQDGGLC